MESPDYEQYLIVPASPPDPSWIGSSPAGRPGPGAWISESGIWDTQPRPGVILDPRVGAGDRSGPDSGMIPAQGPDPKSGSQSGETDPRSPTLGPGQARGGETPGPGRGVGDSQSGSREGETPDHKPGRARRDGSNRDLHGERSGQAGRKFANMHQKTPKGAGI